MERRLSASITRRMLDLAGLSPGMRVLDVATGRGEPAIPAAHRVAPSGSVLGVDVSGAMLELARERADAENVTNLELRIENAESLNGVPSAHFDAALARWGLMYFSSPVSALKEVSRTLREGGVFVAAFWAEPERVPCMSLPRTALAKYAPLREIDLEAPGMFAYAREERIRRDFSAGGLNIECCEEHDTPLVEAATERELVAWARTFAVGRLLNDFAPEIQAAWEAYFLQEARASSPQGKLVLGGVTRIVVAKKC
jgi:ubiquinone/menaquinone biosynthesis C-methylase UbiE